MTLDEAIKQLKELKGIGSDYIPINNALDMAIKALEEPKGEWIDIDYKLPKNDEYVLLSFANFSVPLVGRYYEDEDGGNFFVGDETEPLIKQGIFVNGWLPLPKCMRG